MAKSNLEKAQDLVLSRPHSEDLELQLNALYDAEPAGAEKHMIGMLCGAALQHRVNAKAQGQGKK